MPPFASVANTGAQEPRLSGTTQAAGADTPPLSTQSSGTPWGLQKPLLKAPLSSFPPSLTFAHFPEITCHIKAGKPCTREPRDNHPT